MTKICSFFGGGGGLNMEFFIPEFYFLEEEQVNLCKLLILRNSRKYVGQ